MGRREEGKRKERRKEGKEGREGRKRRKEEKNRKVGMGIKSRWEGQRRKSGWDRFSLVCELVVSCPWQFKHIHSGVVGRTKKKSGHRKMRCKHG